MFWHEINEIPGEQPTPTTYEFSTDDWDDGLWEEQLGIIEELIDQQEDLVVIWTTDRDDLTRFSIGRA